MSRSKVMLMVQCLEDRFMDASATQQPTPEMILISKRHVMRSCTQKGSSSVTSEDHSKKRYSQVARLGCRLKKKGRRISHNSAFAASTISAFDL